MILTTLAEYIPLKLGFECPSPVPCPSCKTPVAAFALSKCTNGVWRCGNCRLTHRRENPKALTAAEVLDRRLQEARSYREELRTKSREVWGVFPGVPVVVDLSLESRVTIMGAFTYAEKMAQLGFPSSFSFDDATGGDITLDGPQTIALGLNVAAFSGMCDLRLKAIRQQLADALAAGATAEDLAAIDVTAGYP